MRAKLSGLSSAAAQSEAKASAADMPAVKASAAAAETAPQTATPPQQQQQQQTMPDDVSIFSVKKIVTADGKVEVIVTPLPALAAAAAAPNSDSNLSPQVSTAAIASNPASISGANPASAAVGTAATAAPKACAKPELSSHEADIAFTAGQNGLSQTTLSASCAAAAPSASTMGGGCSLRCDFEEDLAKITLVSMQNMTAQAEPKGKADKPAVCR
jgi:hypothetical protein